MRARAPIVTSTIDSTVSRCIGEGWVEPCGNAPAWVQLLNGGLPLGSQETAGLVDAAVGAALVDVSCAYALLANRPTGP